MDKNDNICIRKIRNKYLKWSKFGFNCNNLFIFLAFLQILISFGFIMFSLLYYFNTLQVC